MPSCDPNVLMAAAAQLRKIPQGLRQQVIIYLLQQIAGLGGLTPNELAERAKCLCGLSEHDMKAIEVALLCTATGGVPPCPPSGGGAGCNYQDMQVAWTPTTEELGREIYWGISGSFSPNLTSFTFNGVTADAFDANGLLQLTTVLMPNLTNLIVGGDALISFRFCPLLTTFSAPLWKPNNGDQIDFRNDALNASSVNALLAAAVSNPTWGNIGEGLQTSGGTSSAPTGQGIADKATLIGRGATVNTN